ncbi:hypothetical protein G6N05_11965 [Flavobacterium sp. F372]|uniref:DUF1835 domain-containing protein n=1 Tax=Flavobacterium bernardetii TaxID=2813823 RepID=A0ABR7IZC7_9FLAO|nr:hypothetical protein [Flavobacterium bernardetii]MBC5835058.1 hypothetical protein [Flavobacterium bernardetii]NHF70826.1 hypothetical protein [Flavobacterium bernardetii]
MKQIILISFNEIEARLKEGYTIFSITGKVYGNYSEKEEVKRIKGLNTFRYYYHERARDYLACFVLYRNNLNRLGFERVWRSIIEASDGTEKIAICDKNIDSEFCYRYIFADFLIENNIGNVEFDKNVMLKQKDFWKYDVYKVRGHHNITLETVKNTLESFVWHFAKTMPKTPHFYTLRKEFDNHELFLSIVKHIRNFGELNIYQDQMYRRLTIGKFQYWTMACDLEDEDCDLINKCELN